MKYNVIAIDALNLLYRLQDASFQTSILSKKLLYKDLATKYIEFVTYLEKEYLAENGLIYFLQDPSPKNHTKKKTFQNIGRRKNYKKYKENRKYAPKEFYNTYDLLKYYYLCKSDIYKTIQIQNYEADDFVKPLLDYVLRKDDKLLMVTNDGDWTRYLKENQDWMIILKYTHLKIIKLK